MFRITVRLYLETVIRSSLETGGGNTDVVAPVTLRFRWATTVGNHPIGRLRTMYGELQRGRIGE